jgi:hypothetical protein
VPDTATDDCWPDWAARAHAAGVYSSLSIGLPIQDAAVAMANAHLYDTTASLAHHMQAAMESRAVIEQDSNRKLRDVAAALVNRAALPPEKT